MEYLHTLLCILLTFFALLVIFSSNPVESMVALIIMFCVAGVLLLILNSEFLGVTFIIIYVGAIAVLFLFLIMMLNMKETRTSYFIKRIITLLMGILMLIASSHFCCDNEFCMSLREFLKESIFFKYNIVLEKLLKDLGQYFFDQTTNILVIGQTLFNSHSFTLILAGFVLLVALIGSISLVSGIHKRKEKEVSSRQLSRKDTFMSYFRRKKKQ